VLRPLPTHARADAPASETARVVAVLDSCARDRREVVSALSSEGLVPGEASAASLGVAILEEEPGDVVSTVNDFRARVRGAPVIVVGPHSLDVAIAALTSGAVDYLPRPLDLDKLRLSAATHAPPISRVVVRSVRKADLIVGDSEVMRATLAQIERAARGSFPVLLNGESGTGKELAARAIHDAGSRRGGPFVAINAGAISDSLADAELFGALRGAYTGADRDRPGLFAEASGGTLFLDEIATASPAVQAKLLRVLPHNEVRVIAATNVDLRRALADGTLRNDLYYRLAAVQITMPPLRERKSDLPMLVAHHLALLAARAERRVPQIAPDALALLARHDWPGNVRELVNLLANAMLRARANVVRASDLALPSAVGKARAIPRFREARQRFEAEYVREVLAACNGSITEAARIAGRERKDFYELCRRARVDATAFRLRTSEPDDDERLAPSWEQ